MSESLIWMSAIELRDRMARGELSSVALVEACLARIDELDSTLRAFVHVNRVGALTAARHADEKLRRGEEPGPLHGIPVAIKDDMWAEGMPATAGSLIFSRFIPSRDGTVVRRLRKAGAIILGKTNLPEFASWPRTKSWVGGETVNSWDLARIPGASSGGSGAAVAAGMVPLAIGTDGGGSVRIPASLCGIVGMLPTIGRVPDHGGFLCSPISSCGPMARTVTDMTLLLQVIAGPDEAVANSQMGDAPPFLAGLDNGVAGLRVGWSPDYGHISVQPGVLAAAGLALGALQKAGAIIERITRPIPHPWGEGELMAGAYAAASTWDEPDPDHFGGAPETAFAEDALSECSANATGFFATNEVRELLRQNAHLLTPPHRILATALNANAVVPAQEDLQGAMDAIFAEHDVLCSPTMAWIAPEVPDGWASPYPDDYSGTNFTFIANATGCPGISLPCGLSDGMPVGFQVIGRPGDEATVLRVARAIESGLPVLPHPTAIAG